MCAGFKLDTLLKLADVKGVDRKTSLLHFVLDQLLKDSASMGSLSTQLGSVRPAANLQVRALSPSWSPLYSPLLRPLKMHVLCTICNACTDQSATQQRKMALIRLSKTSLQVPSSPSAIPFYTPLFLYVKRKNLIHHLQGMHGPCLY